MSNTNQPLASLAASHLCGTSSAPNLFSTLAHRYRASAVPTGTRRRDKSDDDDDEDDNGTWAFSPGWALRVLERVNSPAPPIAFRSSHVVVSRARVPSSASQPVICCLFPIAISSSPIPSTPVDRKCPIAVVPKFYLPRASPSRVLGVVMFFSFTLSTLCLVMMTWPSSLVFSSWGIPPLGVRNGRWTDLAVVAGPIEVPFFLS
ncbi:hypothetical protein CI238_03392 [Colletotrichum incanum]|uniref:Uncharacterized protein n=1 Tax=Colletotrichum incanum TaxID=1573173 RepID=A0A167ARK3_COLIC|nr:hypothetical protein CI238_03392 [Colletotrichum incanum]